MVEVDLSKMSLESLKELVKQKEKEERRFKPGDKVSLVKDCFREHYFGDHTKGVEIKRLYNESLGADYEVYTYDKKNTWYVSDNELEPYVEEDYCVNQIYDIKESGSGDLVYSDGASFVGLSTSVAIEEKFVQCIATDGMNIRVFLKGNKQSLEDYKILWKNES